MWFLIELGERPVKYQITDYQHGVGWFFPFCSRTREYENKSHRWQITRTVIFPALINKTPGDEREESEFLRIISRLKYATIQFHIL